MDHAILTRVKTWGMNTKCLVVVVADLKFVSRQTLYERRKHKELLTKEFASISTLEAFLCRNGLENDRFVERTMYIAVCSTIAWT